MPTDTQIPGPQPQAAPSNYTVPNSVEFLLKTVNASFEGSGAAGDWLPAVVLLSDSGHVIVRAADQAVKVTAGDDAEVSWFPGVKRGGGSATASIKQPVFTWEQDVGTGDFPVGTYQPNIIGVHYNADGGSSFIISPIDPSQLLVAYAGIYNVAVEFAAGDNTLTAGSSVAVTATVGAFGGGTNAVSVGGPSAGTVGFDHLTGVIGPFDLAVNDQIGINFTVGQHFHFVNKFGGTIFRLGGPKTV